jgi:hypothetical protein
LDVGQIFEFDGDVAVYGGTIVPRTPVLPPLTCAVIAQPSSARTIDS